MVVGLGLDLVELARVHKALARFGVAFAAKVLHEDELCRMPSIEAGPDAALPFARAVAHLSARIAAKEAAVKALGTGFSEGISLHDVRVQSLPSGQPCLTLHGKAEARAKELGAARSLLSLTHGRQTAAAVVVLEGVCKL